MMMMMMMTKMRMCLAGFKYSVIEESRLKKNKRTQYFNITLLSSEVYFDVHSDYMTSWHHLWYKSGFVLLKNDLKKNEKKNREIPLFKSALQLCAHSVCTANAVIVPRAKS